MAPPPKCLYEILDVSRMATDEELKKAYRIQALAHHPDKNPDSRDEAEETFKLIQHAYTVLSDPHERAWYDAHRTQILRGVDVTSGQGGTGDAKTGAASATELDLFSYFSPTAYSGTSGEKGFFSVFAQVFETLAREEEEDSEDSSNHGDRKSHRMPVFGGMEADWSTVREFYAVWEAFTSAKTFAFADKWNLAEAPSRDYRRPMERENKRERAKVRKEFNSTVRELVSFVKKRDPRISRRREQEEQERVQQEARAKIENERRKQQRKVELEHARVLRDEALEEDAEELDEILANIALDERIDRRQRRAEKRQKYRWKRDNDNSSSNESENSETDEGGSEGCVESDEGTYKAAGYREAKYNGDANGLDADDAIESDESAETETMEELYCAACRKSFRTLAQKCDHERSKKHKSNMGKLQREVLREEAEFAEKSGRAYHATDDAGIGDISHVGGAMDDVLPERESKGKRKKKGKKHRGMEEALQASMDESINSDRDTAAQNDVEIGASESESPCNGQIMTEGLDEKGVGGNTNDKKEDKSMSKKMKRRLKEQLKKNEQAKASTIGKSVPQRCNKCGATFPSRTKLMNHVRESGHALHIASRN